METPKSVALLAPVQLRDGFKVLLESEPGLNVIACATSFESFQTALAEGKPDVILMYVSKGRNDGGKGTLTSQQVGQIKANWSLSVCIALIKSSELQEEVRKEGADLVLLDGISPAKLLAAICAVE